MAKMKQQPKRANQPFPPEIYVTVEEDGDITFLSAHETTFEAAEAKERTVAIYHYAGSKKVKLVAEVTD